MLDYSLHENVLTKDETDYMAMIQNSQKCGIDDVIDDITGPGSILKETESVAVTHAVFKALGKRLARGEGFQSEYLAIDHSISGVFTSIDDVFDPKRHAVNVNVRLASTLREMTSKIPVNKVKSTTPMPTLEQVYDHWTQTSNDVITPRSSVDIQGINLKIGDPEDAQQGIFLADAKNAEVRIDRLSLNQPKKLVFSVPEGLKKGDYTLIVRTVMRGTKKIREGRLNQILVVI